MSDCSLFSFYIICLCFGPWLWFSFLFHSWFCGYICVGMLVSFLYAHHWVLSRTIFAIYTYNWNMMLVYWSTNNTERFYGECLVWANRKWSRIKKLWVPFGKGRSGNWGGDWGGNSRDEQFIVIPSVCLYVYVCLCLHKKQRDGRVAITGDHQLVPLCSVCAILATETDGRIFCTDTQNHASKAGGA